MAAKAVSALLIAIGIIHLLPLAGVLGIQRLNALYDIAIAGNDLEILMRHRAILFGLLGGFFCYASLRPHYQPVAFILAGVSTASFVLLAFLVGDFNHAIRRVVAVDVLALVLLLVAIVLYLNRNPAHQAPGS